MLHTNKDPENRDPITGAPGAHPLGTGLGAAAGGAVAGAAIVGAAVAGPVGAAAGAAVGAVVGGLGGKAIAEYYDPTLVDDHWRENYKAEPYNQAGLQYEDYSPAYRLGAAARAKDTGDSYDDIEDDLQSEYDRVKGASRLSWEHAKHAVRAAWNRADEVLSGAKKSH